MSALISSIMFFNHCLFKQCPNFELRWHPSLSIPTKTVLFTVRSYVEGSSRKFRVMFRVELEKAMAPHSSTLARKIPWTEEPGGLQSMGSLRVRYDWATSLFTFMHWRGKWQPTPVFLPGESQGWGSLVGCRLWGRTESDTTEAT